MEPRKLTKADIDSVRHIEGFPNGRDEDIIALSDAPYYTACPNPFIAEFIAENGTPYDEGKVSDSAVRNSLLTLLTGILNRNAYKCNRFIVNKYNPNGRINGPKSGTLYIPSLVVEQNIADLLEYKVPQLMDMFCSNKKNVLISTQSSTDLSQIPDNSIDYIFTDPPFGDNPQSTAVPRFFQIGRIPVRHLIQTENLLFQPLQLPCGCGGRE